MMIWRSRVRKQRKHGSVRGEEHNLPQGREVPSTRLAEEGLLLVYEESFNFHFSMLFFK